MIRNYFKIAWRTINKYRFYATINILGLLTGITFALLIGAYVWDELQVNRTLKNSDRQYVLKSNWKKESMGVDFATLGPIAKHLKEDYPSLVKNYYRFDGISTLVSKGDVRSREHIQLGDSSLLRMYGFKLLQGHEATALVHPYSVVITANKALKYFGKDDVVGETITIHNFKGEKQVFHITGVLKPKPRNSVTCLNNENSQNKSLRTGLYMSTNACAFFGRSGLDVWSNIFTPSYIELKEGVSGKDLEIPIQKLIAEHASEKIKNNLNIRAVSLTDFYLEKDEGVVKKMLYTLSLVGLFVLLMAIINFISISISMSGSRMKEIGVRKVLGGVRRQLIFQFLIESFLQVLCATLLAVFLFSVLRPFLNQILGVEIPELANFPVQTVYVLIALVVGISILAGTYPAFILSSFKSIAALKGTLRLKNVVFQRTLVGIQFSVALLIVISAFLITRQIDYFFNKDLGYTKDYLLSAQVPRDWTDKGVRHMETIRKEFEKLPEITKASVSYEIPNGNNGAFYNIHKIGAAGNASVSMVAMNVDNHYFETYDMVLRAPIYANETAKAQRSKVVINETAARALGWENPMDALGEQIKIKNGIYKYTIKSVVKDFHFGSMKQHIEPVLFFSLKTFPVYRYLSFRVKKGEMQATIASIQNKWEALMPESVFDYRFMDTHLSKLYASEIKFKKIVYNASLIALILVVLGVIALVSLNTHKRVKEMGVRKILGASILNIILLFIKEFMLIIGVASLVAVPLSYYFIKRWLNNYAYQIDISIHPFLIVVTGLVGVTFLLIAALTFKAATTNPSKSLRTE